MAKKRKLIAEAAVGNTESLARLQNLASVAAEAGTSGTASNTVLQPDRPGVQSSIHGYLDNEARKALNLAIAMFFYENGISFNVADQPSFKEAVDKIIKWSRAHMHIEYTPPSSFPLRTTLLDMSYDNVQERLQVM